LYDCDWIEAERRFSSALEHDPEPALICADCAFYAWALGRAEDAEPRMRRVVENDPLMVFYRLQLAFLLAASTRIEDLI
jgi:Tfp pilus assembly protein PilF